MPRYALKIEYDGAPFCGWQCQDGPPSVQQAIEEAIRKLEPKADGITAAGRTDTGVHATGQVAHVDLNRYFPSKCSYSGSCPILGLRASLSLSLACNLILSSPALVFLWGGRRVFRTFSVLKTHL